MDYALIVVGLISLVSLVLIFMMSSNISKLKAEVEQISYVVQEYQKKTGLGVEYTCDNCGKVFVGKQDSCPHCGHANDWENKTREVG